MKAPSFNVSLLNSLSRERLTTYLAHSSDDLEKALLLYEQNMRLSAAFYVPLQCLEVCLRNKLQQQLWAHYGIDWYRNGKPGFNRGAVEILSKTTTDLQKTTTGFRQGSLVAELSFGFWVSLLGIGYDATIWRFALTKAFKANGKNMKRSLVHGRLNMLRRFRNRVAHHEPIFDRPLAGVHSELIEVIGWLCTDTADWASQQSQVMHVLELSRPTQP